MIPVINKTKTALRNLMLKTGQTTCYHVGDDGDYERGWAHRYTVKTTGSQSGTTNVDVACYAAATLSFTAATKVVADSAGGLVTVLTGDTIVIKGSASNDGTYTVAAGGVAGQFTVNEALADELAGAYVTIYKRAAISNNTVFDGATGLEWLRNTTSGYKIGSASTGLLEWYNAASCFTLHPAAADLQMIAASNTLRIVGGSGELSRYHVGDILVCSGFANVANNLPGYRVLSVTVNGADLDIVLDPINNVLVSEVAGGSRSIKIECRSVFAFCAAANAAGLGGTGNTIWRVSTISALLELAIAETNPSTPDAVAFPGWPTGNMWGSSTYKATTTYAYRCSFGVAWYGSGADTKVTVYAVALVRGGV